MILTFLFDFESKIFEAPRFQLNIASEGYVDMSGTDVAKANKQCIVGIGASAGGLEALEVFFKNFPANSGLSFVVIQHLSPDFKSLMDELLERQTSMKVIRVEKATTVIPNCIYLIPPKKNLTMHGNLIVPSDQDPTLQLRLPIDEFFKSLALEYRERAIGVILSGTGSDGTRGCSQIKEVEGFVIAQEPGSCKFDGMPSSAIKQGVTDAVLRPEEMSNTILKYVRHPSLFSADETPTIPESQYHIIMGLLLSVEGLDFSDYRPSTISRRIDRRIKVNHLIEVEDYIQMLREDSEELRFLHGELLINVTRFYRDKEEFDHFREIVIPKLFEATENSDVIRVWSVGCATGQEAYTLAICLLDYMEKNSIRRHIKIFATDVDQKAIDFASAGRYSESIVSDLGEEWISKYFVKQNNEFIPTAQLRRTIIFSHHNALRDPPFTKLNLITCRNVLIYFQSVLQMRALSLMHFGLVSGGFLFLGTSEALGDLSGEFEPIRSGHKIFRKLRDVRLASVPELRMVNPKSSKDTSEKALQEERALSSVSGGSDQKLGFVYEMLLNDFVPDCVVMDEGFQLLHVFGNARKFLTLPMGRTTFDVLKMMNKDLSLATSTAVTRAIKTGSDITFNDVLIEHERKAMRLQLSARPVSRSPNSTKNTIILFIKEMSEPEVENDASQITEVYSADKHTRELVSNLEEQLLSTRESLQSTIEELETTNEELQSANEELMSSNEELQSSNEELQSVNEELHTVNAERQSKIDEVSQVNNDIQYLLGISNIGVLFLDDELCIRRYNTDVQNIVKVMPFDVGRSLSNLSFSFGQDVVFDLINKCLDLNQTVSAEYTNRESTYYFRVSPYIQVNSTTGGKKSSPDKPWVVVCIVDVSATKEAMKLKKMQGDAEEFNYIVSHDLQKPLRRISSARLQIAKLIKDSDIKVNSELVGQLEVLEMASLTMGAMFEEVLYYSRLRTRGGPFKSFRPKPVISTVIQQMSKSLGSATVTVGDLPEIMKGDVKQFKNLFERILQNCYDHRTPNEELVVEIAGGIRNSFVELTVSDNGLGFSEADIQDAFRIFTNAGNKRHGQSLGVGLAMCKRIVERHQGTIWIESEYNNGSVVHMRLPVDPILEEPSEESLPV